MEVQQQAQSNSVELRLVSSTASSISSQPYVHNQNKTIVIGDQGVGKTTLARFLCDGKCADDPTPTLGAAYSTRKIKLDDQYSVNLQIWDVSGKERDRKLVASNFCRGASAAILVYDVTSRKTFNDLESWCQDIDRYCRQSIIRCVVANKCDMTPDREVSRAEGEAFAKRIKAEYFENGANMYKKKRIPVPFLYVAEGLLDRELCGYKCEEEELEKSGTIYLVDEKTISGCSKCC